MAEFLGVFTTALALLSRIPYFRDARSGRTKPHIFSWLVWTLTMAVIAVAQVSGGGGPGAWAAVCAAFANGAILVVALRRGDFQITPSDKISLGACAAAALGWLLTNGPLVAVVLISLLEVFAIIPTMRKSWSRPFEETASLYVLSGVTHVLALFALSTFSAVTALAPLVYISINVVVTTELILRRRLVPAPA